jgi:hypothetical protein
MMWHYIGYTASRQCKKRASINKLFLPRRNPSLENSPILTVALQSMLIPSLFFSSHSFCCMTRSLIREALQLQRLSD